MPAQADMFRTAQRNAFYQQYLRGLADPTLAAKAVRFYVSSEVKAGKWKPHANTDEVPLSLSGPFEVPYWQQVNIADIASLTRAAALVGKHGAALNALKNAPSGLNIAIAERLLEGTIDGRNAAAAAQVLRFAADSGDDIALSRLAFMYRHGLGVTRDIVVCPLKSGPP